nr:DNA helicase [Tanacetum cinerariifolium]
MQTKIELTLEQSQQGVSNDVLVAVSSSLRLLKLNVHKLSLEPIRDQIKNLIRTQSMYNTCCSSYNNTWYQRVLRIFLEILPEHPSDTKVFTVKMEILLEPTPNKLLVDLYTIEFQKHGLPHCHTLLWVKQKIEDAQEVDEYISAKLPNPEEDLEGYKVVSEMMVHGPCGLINEDAPSGLCTSCFRRIVLSSIASLSSKGCKTFKDIQTVNKVIYDTYHIACEALGLLGDDKEWHTALEELAFSSTPTELRNLFVQILIFYEVAALKRLWDTYWRKMSDDIPKIMSETNHISNLHINDPELQAKVLYELEVIRKGQRRIYDRITNSTDKEQQELIFVYGYGGTGKTFLWKVLISVVRSEGKIVLAVVSSRIASLLLLAGVSLRKKLTGPNFIDWYRQLRIVLSIKDKLNYLEQPIPPVPVAPAEPLHAHEMLKELKTLFAQQSEQELLQTTRDFHSCRQEEGKSVSSYVLKMKGYIDNLERLGHPVTLGLGLHEQTLPKSNAPALNAIRAELNPQHQSHYLLKILYPVSIHNFIIMSNTNNNMQTQTSNTLHNAIMEAGSKDRLPMLAPDKEIPISEGSPITRTERFQETYKNVSQDIHDQLNAEVEAVQIILTGIDNDIYSTVDAYPNACEMWKETERLKQGESINHQHEVNEIRAERIARVANPIALVAQQQPVYHPQTHPTYYTQNSSTRLQQAATKNKGKAIVNSPQPIYDQEPSMVAKDDETSQDKEIDKLMALISLSHVTRECQKPKRAKDKTYHMEKMLMCKQEEAGIQLNAEQADWRDDTDDDELEDQELEAHFMYMAQLQEVSSDAADSGPIFDDEPLQKVSNDDHYNVEEIEQNDDDNDLANVRELLASLIKKLKCEIDESKYRNKFLETSNKVLIEKLKSEAELARRNSMEYALQMKIEYAKVRGYFLSYKMEYQKSCTKHTQTITGLNQTISKVKDKLSAHQETISILSQQKEAQIKLYKIREDKELEKVIALENKLKVLDNIIFKTGQSVSTMNMLNNKCRMSFAKPEFLKKAQRANPRLYDRDEVTNLQCDYLELLEKCEGLETELSKKNLSKEFRKEHEQYFEIQDLKAQLQEKGIVIRVIPTTSVSRPQLKSNQMGYSVMHNNSQGKKQDVEDHHRSVKFSKNKTFVTACNDSLNVNFVCATCDKCVLNEKHDICVLYSVEKPLKKIDASESNQKPRTITRNLYERISKACSWWYPKFTPSGYKWKPKSGKENVNPNTSMPLGSLIEIVLFIVDSVCSKHMTGNLKLLIIFVEKFMGTVKFENDQIAPILGYGELVQGAVMIKRVYYVEGLNHNLFSVGQFCDADLEVSFRKSTCFIRDLKGNDLLTGSRGIDLYSITLQDTNSPNPICLLAKATSSQAWLWHRQGIHHQTSIIGTPEQNDVVKRWNRTLVEAARTMLSTAKFPLFFWAKAIATACFTQNCTPDADDSDFASWISIPEEYCLPNTKDGVSKLIDFIYDKQTLEKPNALQLHQKAIVCPRNNTADMINSAILSVVAGENSIYKSSGEALPIGNDGGEVKLLYPTEYLNSVQILGFPSHEIKLKVGAPIMILRNMNIQGAMQWDKNDSTMTQDCISDLKPRSQNKVLEAKLSNKIYNPDRPASEKQPTLIDYIGCLIRVGNIRELGSANTSQKTIRTLDIKNLNGNVVELALWDDMARNFNVADYNSMERPVIITHEIGTTLPVVNAIRRCSMVMIYLNVSTMDHNQTTHLGATSKQRYLMKQGLAISHSLPQIYKHADKEPSVTTIEMPKPVSVEVSLPTSTCEPSSQLITASPTMTVESGNTPTQTEKKTLGSPKEMGTPAVEVLEYPRTQASKKETSMEAPKKTSKRPLFPETQDDPKKKKMD